MTISRLPDNQVIGAKVDVWGDEMQQECLLNGISMLGAGTVLIAKFNENMNIMFESGKQISLTKVRGVDIVYAMPGSRIPMYQTTQNIAGVSEAVKDRMAAKNICFRDCRLPTYKEYSVYNCIYTV